MTAFVPNGSPWRPGFEQSTEQASMEREGWRWHWCGYCRQNTAHRPEDGRCWSCLVHGAAWRAAKQRKEKQR